MPPLVWGATPLSTWRRALPLYLAVAMILAIDKIAQLVLGH
jgi:hypothetical protein